MKRMNKNQHLSNLADTIRTEITQGQTVRLQQPEDVALLMCLTPGELYNFGRNCHAQIVHRSNQHVYDFYDCAACAPIQTRESGVTDLIPGGQLVERYKVSERPKSLRTAAKVKDTSRS